MLPGVFHKICEGIGVAPEHIRVIIPLRKNHEENVRIMQEEFNFRGVSVIISTRECIQTASRRKKCRSFRKYQ